MRDVRRPWRPHECGGLDLANFCSGDCHHALGCAAPRFACRTAHTGKPGRNVWGLADRPRYHIYLALFYVVVPPLLFLLVWSGLIARSWYQSAVDDAAYRLSPTVEDLGTTRTRISQLAALSAEEVAADPFNRDMMAQLGGGDSQAKTQA